MNENVVEYVSSGNTNDINLNSVDYSSIQGIEAQADYYYDYRNYFQTIIKNQETVSKQFDDLHLLVNTGLTTITFCLISAFCYILVKNYIRK